MAFAKLEFILIFEVKQTVLMGVGRSVLRRAVQAPIVERGNLEKVLENAPKLAPKHESTKELLEKSKTGW